MFKKRAQGLSITVIVAAVIGLIIIVVIIAILTGKLGAFSSGVESAASCENKCEAIGRVLSTGLPEDRCKTESKGLVFPGGYKGAAPDQVCCCVKPQ